MAVSQQKKSWKERIKDRYRLVILSDDTLKEVSSIKLNILNFYIILCSLVFVVGLILFLIISFTPLRYTIPGYADITATPEFVQLKKKSMSLEKDVLSLNTYIEAHKNRLLGNSKGPEGENLSIMYNPKRVESLDTLVKNKKSVSPKNEIISLPKSFFRPVNGSSISAHFNANDHFGVDIIATKNSPITAISAGTIISSEYNIETGNTISIQHDDNVISVYKHNSKLLKDMGDIVKSGEAIAIIGNTGTRTDGYHLHFELWMNGIAVNPVDFINLEN